MVQTNIRALNDARDEYAQFHRQLEKFVDDLPSKFRDNVPAGLSKVTSVPHLLRPDCPDFSVKSAGDVIKVTRATLEASDRVVATENRYLDCWLEGKKHTLNAFLEVASTCFVRAGVQEDAFKDKVDLSKLNVDDFASSSASKQDKDDVKEYLKALAEVSN